jgi:hypothetical protein
VSRTLGVNCSSKHAFLTLAEDGEIVATNPERLEPPGTEESERLRGFYHAFRRVLADLRPDRVCLLLPESNPRHRPTHAELTPRIGMETLVRLAAVESDDDVEIEVLARPTVRSRLGLGNKGKLVDLVPKAIPEPIGHHWKNARDLAALAALAGERS